MSNRLLKLLPILLAFVLVCSLSVFAVFAAEESTEASAEVSTEASAETSAEDEHDHDHSGETSGTTSGTTSDPHAGHDHGTAGSGLTTLTWQLIITGAVLVVLVAVLVILAHTNTKIGQKIANFFKNNKSELKKVVWMPKNDLIKSTGIVLLVLVAACILIGLLDFAFSSLLNLISSIG